MTANQNDFVIANGTGIAVRQDIEDALQALAGNSSGDTEPSVKYAYQWWADTSSGAAVMKLRNSSNDGWIEIFQLDGTLTMENGSASAPGLGFRTDLDTGLFLNAAGELGITAAGTNRMLVTATKGVLIGTDTEGNGSADNLTIGDSGNAGITIRSGTTSSGNLYFSDGTSGNAEFAGYLQYDHNANKLYLGAGENNGIIIDGSTGSDIRVGINNTNVSALNASADDLVITKSANCGMTIQSGSSNDGNIFFADGTSGSAQYSGFIQYSHSQDEMRLGSSGDNALVIQDVSANRDVHISTGDIVFDVAGRGVEFSGYGAGSVYNTLNDYEEGDWTPNSSQGMGTVHNAKYTKIGRLVHISFYINAPTSTSGGDFLISNLPFTLAGHYGIGSCYTQMTSTTYVFLQANQNGTSMNVLKDTGVGISFATLSGGYILGSLTYMAA